MGDFGSSGNGFGLSGEHQVGGVQGPEMGDMYGSGVLDGTVGSSGEIHTRDETLMQQLQNDLTLLALSGTDKRYLDYTRQPGISFMKERMYNGLSLDSSGGDGLMAAMHMGDHSGPSSRSSIEHQTPFANSQHVAGPQYSFGTSTNSPCSSGRISSQNTYNGQSVLQAIPLVGHSQPVSGYIGTVRGSNSYGAQKGSGPRLFCGHVPKEVTEEHVKMHFSRWGTVTDVYFPRHKKTLKRRPFCFVTFERLEAAQSALSESPLNICGFPIKNLTIVEDRDKYYHDKHELTRQTLLSALQSSPIIAGSNLTKEQVDNVAALLAMDGASAESVLASLEGLAHLQCRQSTGQPMISPRHSNVDAFSHRRYQMAQEPYTQQRGLTQHLKDPQNRGTSSWIPSINSSEPQGLPSSLPSVGSFVPLSSEVTALYNPTRVSQPSLSISRNSLGTSSDGKVSSYGHPQVPMGQQSPYSLPSDLAAARDGLAIRSGNIAQDCVALETILRQRSLDFQSDVPNHQVDNPCRPLKVQDHLNESKQNINIPSLKGTLGSEPKPNNSWVKAPGLNTKTTDLLGPDYPEVSRKSI
eukprot:jgi/Picsp_1/2410/NSC_05871-R1_heterogeneous nuclear ribonucleoprotein a1-like